MEKGEIKTTIDLNQRYTERDWGNNSNEHPVNNMGFGKNKHCRTIVKRITHGC